MVTKRDYIIAVLFFLIGVITTSIYAKTQQPQLSNKAQIKGATISKKVSNGDSQALKTYSNARFGFSIEFPASWPVGQESVNGDGIAIYNDKPNNEILVYGSNIPWTFSTQNDPVERENVTLNNGSVVTTLKFTDSSGKINYIMFFNKNNRQYVFYATVTKEFFSKNEHDILNALKSFKVWR